jgi:hypothetical protein
LIEDHFRDHQVARQAIGAFHDDDLNAVALDSIEDGGETRTRVQDFRSADTFVAELLDQFVLRGLAESNDRGSLPREAVTLDLTLAAARR